MDYCNSLLQGTSQYNIAKLQSRSCCTPHSMEDTFQTSAQGIALAPGETMVKQWLPIDPSAAVDQDRSAGLVYKTL